ncbi:MAG: M24 family metallopeptidase, partial [Planctomycetota bacterium]
MSGSKPGRNEPCWCGSGKKYKKCHLEADRGSAKGTVPPAAGVGSALVDTASGLQGGLGLAKRTRRDPLQLGEAEREAMRRACAFNAQLLDHVRPHVQPGVSTEKLDKIVHEYTLDHGHTPACLGYLGYPKTICTSINEVVCHGIPSPTEVLKEGDIVNVDLTTVVDGWFGDQSETFMIGEVPERTRELVQVTFDCLWAGLRAIRPSGSVNDIGRAIEVIRSAIAADSRALREPLPTVAVSELGDSSVNLVVRPWCSKDDYWALRWDLVRS